MLQALSCCYPLDLQFTFQALATLYKTKVIAERIKTKGSRLAGLHRLSVKSNLHKAYLDLQGLINSYTERLLSAGFLRLKLGINPKCSANLAHPYECHW